jgi:hypothetical protein
MNKDDEKPRKRGRPRKNTIQQKTHKNFDMSSFEISNEEIVLQLPLGDDDGSEKNVFTMKGTESESCTSIKTISKDYNTDKKFNMNDIISELKRKDALIAHLKKSIEDLKIGSACDNVISATKENKKSFLDLKLISMDNNKSVIVEKTDICCWWCAYNFDTLPCFLPDRFFKDTYYVFGCFCCFSCAMAYNISLDDYRTPVRNSLLKKFYNTIFKNDKDITCTPKRELLGRFGGPITPTDFRNSSVMCKRDMKMNIPPVIPLISLIEETSKDFPVSLSTRKNAKSTSIDDNMELIPKKNVKKGKAYQSTS